MQHLQFGAEGYRSPVQKPWKPCLVQTQCPNEDRPSLPSKTPVRQRGLAEAGQNPATTVTASNEVNHIVASTEMRSGRGWQDRVQHRSIKDFAGDAEKVHMHATSCECGKPSQERLDVSSYAVLCPFRRSLYSPFVRSREQHPAAPRQFMYGNSWKSDLPRYYPCSRPAFAAFEDGWGSQRLPSTI